jgi:hypothetical protein
MGYDAAIEGVGGTRIAPQRLLVGLYLHKGLGEMTKTVIAAFAAVFALAACSKGDTTADTTTIPGVDTTAGMAVPTTDTVVKTTETDTIQGEAKRDSVTKAKSKTP